MPAAYAIAHLHDPQVDPDVLEYLERIQTTLDPFGGRFLVHGATVEVREGEWPGTVVVIAFPDVTAARDWYDSRPTARSCRCAPITSPLRRSSSRASTRTTT